MDFGHLFWSRTISVKFELEQVEFGMLISGIPLLEKSQTECNLTFKTCGLSMKTKVIYQLIVKVVTPRENRIQTHAS